MNKNIVSIDCWGCLIKSAPAFHAAKLELTKQYFGLDEEHSANAFKAAKVSLDTKIEATGIQPTNLAIWEHLFYTHLVPGMGATRGVMKKFYHDYQALALRYPPVMFNSGIEEGLRRLSESFDLILSSNTLLINGTTLANVLKSLGLSKYFSSMNFSDKLGCAKPNPRMYGESKFHIGDNPITDGIGAENAGSTSIIIHSNGRTLMEAVEIIEKTLLIPHEHPKNQLAQR